MFDSAASPSSSLGKEINSEQLEKRNSLAVFIILPSVMFCGAASKKWMHIQYLT